MAKSFTSTVRVESKIPEWEGVAFTVRRFTEGLRIRLRTDLSTSLERIREIVAEAESLEGQAKADPKTEARLQSLSDSIERLQSAEIDRAYVRAGLVKVEGLEIDGQPATTDALIENGPRDLYREILAAVKREAGLTETERKNSESPTTSGEAVGGETSTMTAANASGSGSTSHETVTSTSPAA